MSSFIFFKEFFTHAGEIGSVIPSSRFLARKILQQFPVDEAKVVVEFGAGEGVITRALLSALPEDARLYSFEINEKFVDILRTIDDPRFTIVHGGAEQLPKLLTEWGISEVDAVVSGLPLALFSTDLIDAVVGGAARSLKPGGVYTQFQYAWTSLPKLRKHFTNVTMTGTPLNLPPAIVYRAIKD